MRPQRASRSDAAHQRLELVQLATDIGNVSKACDLMGVGRATYYRALRRLREQGDGGDGGLLPADPHPPPPKRRLSPADTREVLRLAVEHPDMGRESIYKLVRRRSRTITRAGVRRIWRLHGLETAQKRRAARKLGDDAQSVTR